jgi:hypothetical protein
MNKKSPYRRGAASCDACAGSVARPLRARCASPMSPQRAIRRQEVRGDSLLRGSAEAFSYAAPGFPRSRAAYRE